MSQLGTRSPQNEPDTVDDMEHFQGACRFCGQIHIVVPLIQDPTTDQLDEIATLACECGDARRYQNFKASEKRAQQNINTLVEDEESQKILLAAVEPIAAYKIASVQIDDGTGRKYTLKMGKDKVKITKTKTRKETAE